MEIQLTKPVVTHDLDPVRVLKFKPIRAQSLIDHGDPVRIETTYSQNGDTTVRHTFDNRIVGALLKDCTNLGEFVSDMSSADFLAARAALGRLLSNPES